MARKFGYVRGPRTGKMFKVGNTGAITSGDLCIEDGAGDPYIMRATDGTNKGTLRCVAGGSCSAPTTDGDYEIFGYTSRDTVFRMPVVTGTVATTDEEMTCDVGVSGTTIGADVNASTDDILLIVGVDTTNNEVLVKVDFDGLGWGSRTGVV